jgi:hypothetical protein
LRKTTEVKVIVESKGGLDIEFWSPDGKPRIFIFNKNEQIPPDLSTIKSEVYDIAACSVLGRLMDSNKLDLDSLHGSAVIVNTGDGIFCGKVSYIQRACGGTCWVKWLEDFESATAQ